ncbi:hypothetical protein PSTT_01888 [Puccinia striiformis]|uniref:Uncharacterized protein n=1 Tax=Puccinia striiformis TaxID=27350 RepID=A0A2S4W1Q4_9BASI|nr:hypothetical protein PSTT_01888 [Puccinia striiformis]
MPRSVLHTSCLALYVIAAIHVATRPTICYGASLAKRAIERETDRILPVIRSCPNQSEAAPSKKPVRLFGVDISDGHNAGLEVAPTEIANDDPRSSSLALKPDDKPGYHVSLLLENECSLEVYAALVPELYRCRFGNKGTILELLKYLEEMNSPLSLPKHEALKQRIDNTMKWLHSKRNTRYKEWTNGLGLYREVESDFETIKARKAFPKMHLEIMEKGLHPSISP